jgi:hypothetical protein
LGVGIMAPTSALTSVTDGRSKRPSPRNSPMSVLQLRIKGRLYAFGAALAAGVAVAVTIGVLSFNQLHVGGPVYTKIVEGKDLVADILPPPAYVIEAYLEATLALDRAKPLADSRAGLKKLHDDYDDRRKYWQDSGWTTRSSRS